MSGANIKTKIDVAAKRVAAEFYPALCHPRLMILDRRSTYLCKA